MGITIRCRREIYTHTCTPPQPQNPTPTYTDTSPLPASTTDSPPSPCRYSESEMDLDEYKREGDTAQKERLVELEDAVSKLLSEQRNELGFGGTVVGRHRGEGEREGDRDGDESGRARLDRHFSAEAPGGVRFER